MRSPISWLIDTAYNFPNDEKEQDRLDLNHHLCLLLLDDRLHLCDLPEDMAIRILDIGTGTGIWAMDMGDKFPNAQVIGNELSPIQPRWLDLYASSVTKADRLTGYRRTCNSRLMTLRAHGHHENHSTLSTFVICWGVYKIGRDSCSSRTSKLRSADR